MVCVPIERKTSNKESVIVRWVVYCKEYCPGPILQNTSRHWLAHNETGNHLHKRTSAVYSVSFEMVGALYSLNKLSFKIM